MPWHIGEPGTGDCAEGEYPVVNDESGETEGCHASKEEAQAQLEALYANEPEADESSRPAPAGMGRFRALVCVEGERTVDTGGSRIIERGALTWPSGELAIPLTWLPENGSFGHKGAIMAGTITSVTREGDEIFAEGVWSSDPAGQTLRQQVRDGMAWGCSIDPAQAAITIEMTADGAVVEKTVEASLDGVTVVMYPAIDGTWIRDIEDPAEQELMDEEMAMVEALFASGSPPIPTKPPARWFAAGPPAEPTPITVESDGRVYGHLAGTECHIGYQDQCIKVRDLSRDFSRFNDGLLETAEGERVEVGQITLIGGHPDLRLTAAAARAHYDDTRSAVADVHMSWDDRLGLPFFSGALRPGVTEEQIRVLMASGVSGDWRPIGNDRKLVAALSVNVPGFQMPRAKALVAAGAIQAVVTGPLRRRRPEDRFDRLERQIFDLRLDTLAGRVLR